MYILKIVLKISLVLFSATFLSASWEKLTYIEPGAAITSKTRFINLVSNAFEEKKEDVQEKLSKVSSKDLSNAWIAAGGNECLVLFTLSQAQNSEKLKSLLADVQFSQKELEKALQYVEGTIFIDCFKDIKSLGSKSSCLELIQDTLRQKYN